jgi:uncharacterized membrane protein YeaQ/YmgE (transglycosylase-associated protein family)
VVISLIGLIIIAIIIGLIAGVLAKLSMPGDDPGGIIILIILGVVGALISGFLANFIGFGGGSFIWIIIAAAIGAVILLAIFWGIA